MSGDCIGECTPAAKRCAADAKTPQTCSAAGAWQSGQPCAGSCTDGVCASGECQTGDKRCDAMVPQTCNADGVWESGTVCGRECDNGECPQDCEAGDKQCYMKIPQSCDPSNQWADSPECDSSCVLGVCMPNSGTWTGTTEQSKMLELDVNASGTAATRVAFEWSLDGCGLPSMAELTGTFAIANDALSGAGGNCPHIEVAGDFSSFAAVGGKITLTFSGADCACTGMGPKEIAFSAAAP
jgi:hypothetical protein